MAEFMAAISGFNRAQSGGVQPMTRDRLDELVEEYGMRSQSIRAGKR